MTTSLRSSGAALLAGTVQFARQLFALRRVRILDTTGVSGLAAPLATGDLTDRAVLERVLSTRAGVSG